MSFRFVRLDAHTTADRNQVISELKDAINLAGWLVDCTLFSNAGASFSFEFTRGAAERLRTGLGRTRVVFDTRSRGDLDALAKDAVGLSEAERAQKMVGMMHITFVHNEPDLRREVPKVPG